MKPTISIDTRKVIDEVWPDRDKSADDLSLSKPLTLELTGKEKVPVVLEAGEYMLRVVGARGQITRNRAQLVQLDLNTFGGESVDAAPLVVGVTPGKADSSHARQFVERNLGALTAIINACGLSQRLPGLAAPVLDELMGREALFTLGCEQRQGRVQNTILSARALSADNPASAETPDSKPDESDDVIGMAL